VLMFTTEQRWRGAYQRIFAEGLAHSYLERPWLETGDAGPIVVDDRRLFTTATVIHALALTGKPES